MIVVDASVLIDLIFEYSPERTRSAEELFSPIEERGLQMLIMGRGIAYRSFKSL